VKESVEAIAAKCNTVISMLPNDAIVEKVSKALLTSTKSKILHISCSTISPTVARSLAEEYQANMHTFIASPVFARPDGIAKKQAIWMISGQKEGREVAGKLLASGGKVTQSPESQCNSD
jgi:3-hydroxyisobutyrate dehydrogenase-like beta-hydroxyacid dehydrogenase